VSTILVEGLVEDRRDDVAVLRVERPDRLGALSRPMVEVLGHYLDQLRSDPTVRVFVLTGTGRGFIAGADVTEYHETSQQDFDAYQRLSRRTFDALESLPIPTIAAVNGYAFGGGFEVALCCDFILAATAARFALPEVGLGLIPGGGGTQRLARAIGVRATKEVVLAGARLSAEQLATHGLICRVVDHEQLLGTAIELADKLAAAAPLAIRAAKQVIDAGLQSALPTALTLEQRALSGLFATADAREGIDAFIHKRAAHFAGS